MLRKTEYYTNVGKGLLSNLYKFRLNKMQNKYSLHIPINTCGRGLKVMHLGPILINGMVRIGRDCSIHINTALVAGGGDDGVPTLGNGCVICVGAVICGAVQVADDVVIGANAVVNRDVMESDITVVGVPARKISENGRTSWGRCCVYSK